MPKIARGAETGSLIKDGSNGTKAGFVPSDASIQRF
jgi:hypothetical protein